MKIIITHGVGEGDTEISAFDSALLDAGINNYNLIKLSSVIPPESIVKVKKINFNLGKPCERLYVVISERDEKTKGKKLGLAWVGFWEIIVSAVCLLSIVVLLLKKLKALLTKHWRM